MSPFPGGDERVRTDDPLLAKQVLSQLSYTPTVPAQVRSLALKVPSRHLQNYTVQPLLPTSQFTQRLYAQ